MSAALMVAVALMLGGPMPDPSTSAVLRMASAQGDPSTAAVLCTASAQGERGAAAQGDPSTAAVLCTASAQGERGAAAQGDPSTAAVLRTASAQGERNDLSDPAHAVDFLRTGAAAQAASERAHHGTGRPWDGSLLGTMFGAYRTVLSSQDAPACAFSPSCSGFSQSVIDACGLVEGGLATADRLLRDHPLAAGHYDSDPATGRLRDDPRGYCLSRRRR